MADILWNIQRVTRSEYDGSLIEKKLQDNVSIYFVFEIKKVRKICGHFCKVVRIVNGADDVTVMAHQKTIRFW